MAAPGCRAEAMVIGKPVGPPNAALTLGSGDADAQPELELQQRVFQAATVLFCVCSGFVNGYDICVFAIILPSLQVTFGLCDGEMTCTEKDLVMTVAALGDLVAKATTGWIADKYGRRVGLLLVDTMLLLSAVLMGTSGTTGSFWQFVAGRACLGMATGLALTVEPAYLAEIAPAHLRGRFVVMQEVALCVGCIVALWLGTWWIFTNEGHWTALCWFSIVPASMQLLWLFVLPESPRWLSLHGHDAELRRACHRLGLPSNEVYNMRQEGHVGSARGLLRKHRKGLFLALAFSGFTAGSGAYGFMAYAADFFQVNDVDRVGTMLTLIGWAKLVGALCSLALVDVVGRRGLSCAGGAGCAFACFVLAARWASGSWQVPGAFFLMIFCWNLGFGGLMQCVVSEFVPSEVRSTWSGLALVTNSCVTVAIYATYDTFLLSAPRSMMFVFAMINTAAVLFVLAVMPERRGKVLEAPHSADTTSPAELREVSNRRLSSRTRPVGVASRYRGSFRGLYVVLEETAVGADGAASAQEPADAAAPSAGSPESQEREDRRSVGDNSTRAGA